MKKVFLYIILFIALALGGYVAFIYNITYSEGYKAGELTKITHEGVIFKTWEGEISQGVAEAQRFWFSVEGDQLEVIDDLKNMQGNQVKLSYKKRYGTFPWLGKTLYFVTKVETTEAMSR